MPVPWRILGRDVSPEKQQLAKEFRRSMTPAETVLWERLRRNNLGFHFRRQQGVDGFITDFYCHRAGLVVEVDGSVHSDQVEHDLARDTILQSSGLVVVRFTNDEVEHQIEPVVTGIAEICHLRVKALR